MRRVKIIGNWLMVMGVLLVSVPATAQIIGATQQEEQQAFGASAPAASFQSTSALPSSGSEYSPNPTLNADGTASYGGASYSPAKAPKKPGSIRRDPNNPIVDSNTKDNPLGDAVLPLMLLLCAYAVYKVRARSRSANGSQERYRSAKS